MSKPVRMFCAAHAGGGPAQFARWSYYLPDWIDVCPVLLPARESRFKDPAYTNLVELTEDLAQGLAPYTAEPYALFGYSLGSLIQFELARRLRERNLQMPVKLLVGAARAPQQVRPVPLLSLLEDDDFLQEIVQRYGGLKPEVLQHPQLVSICLPSLRGDFSMLEAYQYQTDLPLQCPIAAFAGTEDQRPRPSDVEPWQDQTTDEFTMHLFPGGHFFINSHRDELLAKLAAELEKSLSI